MSFQNNELDCFSIIMNLRIQTIDAQISKSCFLNCFIIFLQHENWISLSPWGIFFIVKHDLVK